MADFQNKQVIVTGAGQGIGWGICRAFAHVGAVVTLNDLEADLAESAAAQLNAEIGSERVFPHVGDVADVDYLYRLVESVGTPEIVIANAGITQYAEFLESTPEMFDRVMGVNLRGSYFLAQAAAKKMIAQGTAGRIILMSSVTAIRAHLNFSVYSTTKAGLQMMAKALALELGRYGITVNSISPGATLTERTQREDPQYAENWAGVTITERVGSIEDIAHAALFLSAPESRHITGQDLMVDGGWSIRSPLPPNHPEKPL